MGAVGVERLRSHPCTRTDRVRACLSDGDGAEGGDHVVASTQRNGLHPALHA